MAGWPFEGGIGPDNRTTKRIPNGKSIIRHLGLNRSDCSMRERFAFMIIRYQDLKIMSSPKIHHSSFSWHGKLRNIYQQGIASTDDDLICTRSKTSEAKWESTRFRVVNIIRFSRGKRFDSAFCTTLSGQVIRRVLRQAQVRLLTAFLRRSAAIYRLPATYICRASHLDSSYIQPIELWGAGKMRWCKVIRTWWHLQPCGFCQQNSLGVLHLRLNIPIHFSFRLTSRRLLFFEIAGERCIGLSKIWVQMLRRPTRLVPI